MSENKQEHDFNWIRELQNCTLQAQFACIRMDCQEAVRQRNLKHEDFKENHNGRSMFDIKSIEKLDSFHVWRNDDSGHDVHFTLQAGVVKITAKSGKEMIVKLTLTDGGECRFKIDDESGFLRWQVVRRALEELLFAGTTSFPIER